MIIILKHFLKITSIFNPCLGSYEQITKSILLKTRFWYFLLFFVIVIIHHISLAIEKCLHMFSRSIFFDLICKTTNKKTHIFVKSAMPFSFCSLNLIDIEGENVFPLNHKSDLDTPLHG